MIGRQFGRLKVVGLHHRDTKHRKFYSCECECGGRKVVQGALLSSGNTSSCGCARRDLADRQRLPNDAGVVNQIVLQYQRHARDRGIRWKLSRRAVDRLVRQPCHYCGEPAGNLKKTKNHAGFPHNGIDRVDSAKAYTLKNTVACCGLCNRAKRDMPRDIFVAWAIRVANHQRALQWAGEAA